MSNSEVEKMMCREHVGYLSPLIAMLTSICASGQLVINGGNDPDAAARFEKVTVSLTPETALPDETKCGGEFHPDTRLLEYRGVQLGTLVQLAYSAEVDRDTGHAPLWDRYDIRAKVPPNAGPNAVAAMLKNFLGEQCQLVVHAVTKERKAYSLIVGNKGIKFHPASKVKIVGGATLLTGPTGIKMSVSSTSMDQLAMAIGYALHAPVANETGLAGLFDFTLEYFPDPSPLGFITDKACYWPAQRVPSGRSGATASPLQDPVNPSIPDALKDQLGLLLQAHVESATLLVVDHINKLPVQK